MVKIHDFVLTLHLVMIKNIILLSIINTKRIIKHALIVMKKNVIQIFQIVMISNVNIKNVNEKSS